MISQELLEKFLREIQEAQFYEAHETLEAVWFPLRFEQSDEVRLIKGFINAAVSLELLKRGKNEASQKVWKTYLKYYPLLCEVESKHLGMYRTIAWHVQRVKDEKSFLL